MPSTAAATTAAALLHEVWPGRQACKSYAQPAAESKPVKRERGCDREHTSTHVKNAPLRSPFGSHPTQTTGDKIGILLRVRTPRLEHRLCEANTHTHISLARAPIPACSTVCDRMQNTPFADIHSRTVFHVAHTHSHTYACSCQSGKPYAKLFRILLRISRAERARTSAGPSKRPRMRIIFAYGRASVSRSISGSANLFVPNCTPVPDRNAYPTFVDMIVAWSWRTLNNLWYRVHTHTRTHTRTPTPTNARTGQNCRICRIIYIRPEYARASGVLARYSDPDFFIRPGWKVAGNARARLCPFIIVIRCTPPSDTMTRIPS